MAENTWNPFEQLKDKWKEKWKTRHSPATPETPTSPTAQYQLPPELAGIFKGRRERLGEQFAGQRQAGLRALDQRFALQGLGGSGAAAKAQVGLETGLAGQQASAEQQIGEEEAQAAYQYGMAEKEFGLKREQMDLAWQELGLSRDSLFWNGLQVADEIGVTNYDKWAEIIANQFGSSISGSPSDITGGNRDLGRQQWEVIERLQKMGYKA